MDTIIEEKMEEHDILIVDKPVPKLFYPIYYRDRISYLYLKRLYDVVVSLILVVGLLSWLYPILSILIHLSSKGSTLFVQKRVGMNGRIFSCYKFRTMFINNQSDWLGASLNDKRITKIGKLLRKTYIDELPQLVNVLMGDMSIVGPRPHMLYHHQRFCRDIAGYDCRHWMKPGITGLSQVKGYHGWISDKHHIYCRTKLDLFYVQKASLGLDMLILLKTVGIFFSFNKKNKA